MPDRSTDAPPLTCGSLDLRHAVGPQEHEVDQLPGYWFSVKVLKL
jgi:hypothetical protein